MDRVSLGVIAEICEAEKSYREWLDHLTKAYVWCDHVSPDSRIEVDRLRNLAYSSEDDVLEYIGNAIRSLLEERFRKDA